MEMYRHKPSSNEEKANCCKTKGNNTKYEGKEQTLPSTLVQISKGEEKHACNIFYGQHVQSKIWAKRITKKSSKNKSEDKENIHIFQNEGLNIDEKG